ncbi:hypothetical protein [Pseudarcicella hirudinis]|uniref:hypothetical protein n=1 Tax=Pseudarcicella hirudinis TaxID=1079859 RepID=UPI000B815971|nr:hypothetical protein [Pseudarcicella hirudinis]
MKFSRTYPWALQVLLLCGIIALGNISDKLLKTSFPEIAFIQSSQDSEDEDDQLKCCLTINQEESHISWHSFPALNNSGDYNLLFKTGFINKAANAFTNHYTPHPSAKLYLLNCFLLI